MQKPRRIVSLLLLLASTLFAFAAAEWAFRVLVRARHRPSHQIAYRATPWPCVEFDAVYGEHPIPGVHCWIDIVQDGRLVFGTTSSQFNADGLGGRTSIAEYNAADRKILVFGDSFSYWNQAGVTWPDLLQNNLARTTGKRVAVLNYGRGTYGVVQMLDLAADKIAEHHPDLVIIALIGDDLTRNRWWVKTFDTADGLRWMISSRPTDFTDYRYAVDEILVQPEATPEWCRALLQHGGRDAVVETMNARFAALRDAGAKFRDHVPLLAWDHSFLLQRFRFGYTPMSQTIPQIDYDDFADDARTLRNIARLRASGIPVLLVYTPVDAEMRSRQLLLPRHHLRLLRSLERLFQQRVRLLQDEYRGAIPAQINLMPYEGHPNRDGLQMYADGVTPMALPYVK